LLGPEHADSQSSSSIRHTVPARRLPAAPRTANAAGARPPPVRVGAVLAISLRGGFEAAARVAGACELFTRAVSLGGVDTLIQHPASLTYRAVAGEAKPQASVLSLSIGLQDVDDLCADLERALRAA